MTNIEVFKELDWTDETLRHRYQDVILEAGVPMTYACIKDDGVMIMVR